MKYIFANWKMYLDLDQSVSLAEQLRLVAYNKQEMALGVFPSALAFSEVEKTLRDVGIEVGVQHAFPTPQGAYTGEVSAEEFRRAGAVYALVGHSERRHIFMQTNSDVKREFDACVDTGIIPVLCIGETKEDLDERKREYRLKKQLMALEDVDASTPFFVAYEPVWAIGSGMPCDHITAAGIHDTIKQEIRSYTDRDIPVLYGGSVNAENVIFYLPHTSIDGFLIGSASTTYESMTKIIRNIAIA